MPSRWWLRGLVTAVAVIGALSACGGNETDVVVETVVNEDGSSGVFSTSGGAVDSGEICEGGEFENTGFNFDVDPLWFEDEMICADGSGSFVMRVELPRLAEGEEEPEVAMGTWTVVRGTGKYTEIEGSGDYASVFDPQWEETYTGNLRLP